MSITPSLPNMSAGEIKSYWQRKEGPYAKAFLAIAGVGLLYAISIFAIPIITAITGLFVSLMGMCIAGAGFAFLLWLAFSGRVHFIVGSLFKMFFSYFLNWFITVNPIGILRDHIMTLRKKRSDMATQLTNLKGQISQLKSIIERNIAEAKQNMNMGVVAKQRAAEGSDSAEVLRMQLAATSASRKSQRLENANVSYQQLLNKLNVIYSMMSKWLAHLDFFIEDTEDEVKQKEIEFKATSAAYKVYQSAKQAMAGDDFEQDLYKRDIDYLNNEAARKLGEIEEFQSVAQTFMDTMDLKDAAVNIDAMKKLEEYEKKLLTPGTEEISFLKPGATERQPQSVLRDTGTNDYKKLLS